MSTQEKKTKPVKATPDVSPFMATLDEFLESPWSDACFLRSHATRLTLERIFIEVKADGTVTAFSNLTRDIEELRQATGAVIEVEAPWSEEVGEGQIVKRDRLHRCLRNGLKSELRRLTK